MVTDSRTANQLTRAQIISGVNFEYAQGSYNGSVSQSGGTHNLGGVVDIRSIPLRTYAKKMAVVKALRVVGFAAWLRPYVPNLWGEHIHAVSIQDGGERDRGLLSYAAHAQVVAYYDGKDGLARGGPDPHAGLGISPRTWEWWLDRPVVHWSKMGRGKPKSPEVAIVQRHLNRYVGGTPLKVDGVWGPATGRKWARAVVKSGGKRGYALLSFLARRWGLFKSRR